MLCANAEISSTIWLAINTSIGDWGTKQVGVISDLFVDVASLDDIDGDRCLELVSQMLCWIAFH